MSKITLIVPKLEEDEFSKGVNAAKMLCLLAVKEELELPGEMPDDMFDKFKNASNKEEMKNLLVKLVQLTKDNIINRINKVIQ
jgi:hypothetical protein